MNIKHVLSIVLLALTTSTLTVSAQEKIIVLNEGGWQSDNGRLSYFENGSIVSNRWFNDVNGSKLGDTPEDIIQINDNLLAISINWSNIVQFITPQGRAVAATEDIPNNRKLCTDGAYVYTTSYGHEVRTVDGMKYFDKGYVAKIDINTFNVVAAVEVGSEPEGIAIYGGKLFVANTGGYAFQENHDYETTISVVDAASMQVVRTIDTGHINLYGKMSQSGQYLCINSAGDHYDTPCATIIMDCRAVLDGKGNEECFVVLDYASTASTIAEDGTFYAVGSRYSYLDGDYSFNYLSIDPVSVMTSQGKSGVRENALPGTMLSDFAAMSMPCAIYVNPYTGYIYGTDAGSYASSGKLYQWTPEGKLLGTHKVYVTPAHILALPPDGHFNTVDNIITDVQDSSSTIYYNLQGVQLDPTNLAPGLYIQRQGNKAKKVFINK